MPSGAKPNDQTLQAQGHTGKKNTSEPKSIGHPKKVSTTARPTSKLPADVFSRASRGAPSPHGSASARGCPDATSPSAQVSKRPATGHAEVGNAFSARYCRQQRFNASTQARLLSPSNLDQGTLPRRCPARWKCHLKQPSCADNATATGMDWSQLQTDCSIEKCESKMSERDWNDWGVQIGRPITHQAMQPNAILNAAIGPCEAWKQAGPRQ